MDGQAPEDGEPADHTDDASLERILEALLVEDAEVVWDPVTGRPRVARRRKPELDRPPGSA